MKRLICLICLTLLLSLVSANFHPALAEEDPIDESTLFSGDSTVEAQSTVIANDADQELNKVRLGISGEFFAQSTYNEYAGPEHNLFGLPLDDGFTNLITTDLFFDFRYKNGIKSFLSAGFNYYPDGTDSQIDGLTTSGESKKWHSVIKEFFADANWKNKVYFRLGKQVLKWGRSYFWNPTDLINIEKKDFFDIDKNREGVTGIKMHIPSGVKHNVYFFAGLDDVESISDLPLAGKYEWLVGNSEMSLSAWYKGHRQPVFGYDISTRIGKVDWRGELSLANGKDYQKFDSQTGDWVTEDDWFSRASIGFTRSFNHREIKDRISLTGEFYYNQIGAAENIYAKMKSSPDYTGKFFLSGGYQPFMNNRYYMAFFSSITKVFIPELTVNINSITNLVDCSSVLTTGVEYKPTLKNWYFDLNINSYLGESFTEATFAGKSYGVDFSVKILF